MIDPSFDTLTEYPTVEKLEHKVLELETEINRLTSEIEVVTNDREFWQGKARDRQLMIDNLEEWIKEQHDYLDEDTIQSLAYIFGLEITKEYDVQVTVTFTGTVTAPLDYDMDDLENALEARLDTSYYSGDIVVDFMEDNMDIDWKEN